MARYTTKRTTTRRTATPSKRVTSVTRNYSDGSKIVTYAPTRKR